VKHVLVTGGAGFIGSYVVADLVSKGYEVTVLDSRGRRLPGAVTILGDIRDEVAVGEAVAHAEGIIHLAGVLGTAEMIANPRPAIEVNVLGALNVFEAAATHGIPVVNIATGNYWMDNTYSISKDMADRLARMYNAFRGGQVTSVRAFDAYGPGQIPAAPFGPSRVRKIMPSFVCRALSDVPIEVYGDGAQVIDLIYAEDVARVLVDALVATAIRGAAADEVIEAGSGVAVTVLEVAQKVVEVVGKGEIIHLPMRPGEHAGAVIVAKTPAVAARPLYAGLPPTVDWYRDYLA